MNSDESAIPIQAEGGQLTTQDNPYTTNYGSGYGTYLIGGSNQVFAGAELNVGTYANIFTGGSAEYKGIVEGEEYTLTHADGSTSTYTATETKSSVINSDTFGFMFHQTTKTPNTLILGEGTEVNTGYTTFLLKSGASNMQASIYAATHGDITPGNGVLLQVMDNDDATTGGFNPQNMTFGETHTENAGFNKAAAEEGDTYQYVEFSDGTYNGNIYNASGSDASTEGALPGSFLSVYVSEGATLSGGIASTAAIHVTKDGSDYVKSIGGVAANSEEAENELLEYQNTEFTLSEYYDIGQVANTINYNNANGIEVSLDKDAVWNVTADSRIVNLAIMDDAKVVIEPGVELWVAGQLMSSGNEEVVLTAEDHETGVIPEREVGDLAVASTEVSLAVRETSQIEATATNAITYSSEDESIATVDENGLITAVAPGTTYIIVESGQSETMSSTVEAVEVVVTEAETTGEENGSAGGGTAPAGSGGEGAGVPSDGSEGSSLPYVSMFMDIEVAGVLNPAEITANPGTVILTTDELQNTTFKWTYTPVGGPNAGVEEEIAGATSYTYTLDSLVTDPGPGETAGIYKVYANGELYAVAYLGVGLVTYYTDLEGNVIEIGYDILDQKITGVKSKYTVKYKKVKKKAQKVDLSKASAETKLSFKVTKKASKKISVSKSGVVTLKKGAKKGTYVIKITAKATNDYNKATKKVTIKVR